MSLPADLARTAAVLGMCACLAASANSTSSTPTEPEPEPETEPSPEVSSVESSEATQAVEWSAAPAQPVADAGWTAAAPTGCGEQCDDPGTPCGNMLDSARAGSMSASYLAAACLCQCHLELGGCGSDLSALQQCVTDNTTAAASLGSDVPVFSDDPAPSSDYESVPDEPPAEQWECTGPAADQRCVLVGGGQ